jgi:hypothetical protein
MRVCVDFNDKEQTADVFAKAIIFPEPDFPNVLIISHRQWRGKYK